jgi:AcrR family transcriptional regulator
MKPSPTIQKLNGKSQRKSAYSSEKLLRTALELFARHDFTSITIKDIAREAGFTTALIYYYFDSKEHLFRAAIEFAIKTAMKRFSELRDSQTDPVSLVADWFRNNLEMADLIRQLVKIMIDYSGSADPNASIEALIRQFYSMEEHDILAASIERGVLAGTFRKVDPVRVAQFVSVHLDGIMAASIIRSDFDMGKALAYLETVLWTFLGYDKPANRGTRGVQRPSRRTRSASSRM